MCKNVDLKQIKYDIEVIKQILDDIGLDLEVTAQIIDRLSKK